MLDSEAKRGLARIFPIEGRAARIAAWISAAVLAAHWFLVLRFVAVRAGQLSFLRLHYTVAFGIDWVDQWWFIFTFPVLGFLIFVVNARMAVVLARIRPALEPVPYIATALCEIGLAVAGSIAILLNS